MTPDNSLQQAKTLADTTTEYKGEVGTTIDVTPDTEWETVDRYSVETGLLKRFFKLYEEGRKTGDPQNFIDYFKGEHYLLTEVGKAIASRDTYWKERVKKEVEGMKKNENNLGFELKDKWKAEAHNQALDTLLDNLK